VSIGRPWRAGEGRTGNEEPGGRRNRDRRLRSGKRKEADGGANGRVRVCGMERRVLGRGGGDMGIRGRGLVRGLDDSAWRGGWEGWKGMVGTLS
jgi:hypothetical protein